MTTIHPDMPARLGRYEIVRQLGRGAMGVVYEGLDPNIGRRVAIKTARRDVIEASGRADEMIERFLREARAAGGLNHAHIITIYDADEQDGTAYIAMEYVEGTDLQKTIGQRSRFSPEETVALGATVCEALAHAHDNGVVHRDVKPSNIMMLNDGTIRVADFGIARVKDSSLTQEGAMIGTPHYMSPEQFMGQRVDGRSDLFSVGIILYELLTGEKPFHGEAISTVMHAVIKTDPIDPSALNFSVNNVLSEVIMKSLEKAPNQRYADGRAMAAALRESLKEHPDPAITLVGDPGAVGEKTMLVDSSPGIDATVAMGDSGAAKLAGGSMAETVAESPAKPPAPPERPTPQPAPIPAKRGPILAAVAVAVAVAAALGLWAVMPGGEPEGARPGAAAPYALTIQLYRAETPEQFAAALDDPPSYEGLEPGAGAAMTIYSDRSKAQRLGEALADPDGVATLEFTAASAETVFVEITLDGYEVTPLSAQLQGDLGKSVERVVLLKEGA